VTVRGEIHAPKNGAHLPTISAFLL
jgi:hypothetical protein